MPDLVRRSHLPRRAATAVLQGILRIPLVLKVMGANGLIVAVALVLVGSGFWGEDQGKLLVMLAAVAIATVVNLILDSGNRDRREHHQQLALILAPPTVAYEYECDRDNESIRSHH